MVETTAEAFLNTAKQYHLAAKALLPLKEQVESALYFLFTHAIELALKAYLRSHGVRTPHGQKGHALQDLLAECQKLGFRVSGHLRGVVQLLEHENSRHGFRYFAFEALGRPDIESLREVVDALMTMVEVEVSKRPTKDASGVVLKFTIGRAEKK